MKIGYAVRIGLYIICLFNSYMGWITNAFKLVLTSPLNDIVMGLTKIDDLEDDRS